jgi:hypothetical protein
VRWSAFAVVAVEPKLLRADIDANAYVARLTTCAVLATNSRMGSREDFWSGLKTRAKTDHEMLDAQMELLDQLLGPKHWLSVGAYKEDLVRDLLRRRLPERYKVGHGFVCSPLGISRQIDVLVWDRMSYRPIIETGEFVVLSVEKCLVACSVKGNLSATALRESIDNLDSVERHWEALGRVDIRRPCTAIFGFKKPDFDILSTLRRGYLSPKRSIPFSERLSPTFTGSSPWNDGSWVNAIVALDEGLYQAWPWQMHYEDGGDTEHVTYSLTVLPKHVALAFADLVREHLDDDVQQHWTTIATPTGIDEAVAIPSIPKNRIAKRLGRLDGNALKRVLAKTR